MLKYILSIVVFLMAVFAPIIGFSQITTNIKNIGDSCSVRYDSINKRYVYKIVDNIPTYRGGNDTLLSIINKNLKWPNQGCIYQAKVYVGFVIEVDGSISNKKILRGFDTNDYCNVNTEALKVLDFLTDWIPGKCHGKEVPVDWALPIQFRIE